MTDGITFVTLYCPKCGRSFCISARELYVSMLRDKCPACDGSLVVMT